MFTSLEKKYTAMLVFSAYYCEKSLSPVKSNWGLESGRFRETIWIYDVNNKTFFTSCTYLHAILNQMTSRKHNELRAFFFYRDSSFNQTMCVSFIN